MDYEGVSAHYHDMKPIYLQFTAGLMATFVLGAGMACAQQQDTAADPIAEAGSGNWLDAPQTPGDWSYGQESSETLALFGNGSPEHVLVLRCDKAKREVGIARRGASERPLLMRVRTETTERTLTATQVPRQMLVAATVKASDPLLDAMAITKGRFAIEVEGMEPLYIPAWAEVTRVIEDCR